MKQPATRRTALISSSPTIFPVARCSSPAAAAAATPEVLSTQAKTEAVHTSSITTPVVTPVSIRISGRSESFRSRWMKKPTITP